MKAGLQRPIDEILPDLFGSSAPDKLNPLPAQDRRYEWLCAAFLAAVTVLLLTPFSGKAFGVDDPLFLWAARQIQKSPGDPYGFTVNWYGFPAQMWDVTKNPPLASYYLATAALVTGWGEVPLHLAMLLPAIASTLGTFYLARRFCARPFEASLAALVTPVFLISGTSVMSDVMMLALWLWATVCWVRGLERGSGTLLAAGAFLLAASALTKYFGMTLIPLLLIYSFARNRKLGAWTLYLLIPVLILLAYQAGTQVSYGRGLLLDAAEYAQSFRSFGDDRIAKGFVGLVFAGGCFATGLFYLPLLWSRRVLLAGMLVAFVACAVIAYTGRIGSAPVVESGHVRWGFVFQIALCSTGGMNIVALAASDLWRRRDAAALLLFLWIAGVLAFASFVNWTVNGRTLLPMVPAASILLMRRLDHDSAPGVRGPARSGLLILIPAAVIGMLVAGADYSLAGSAREAAGIVWERYGGAGTTWFQGHWGFQYYLEAAGGKAVDVHASHFVLPGDVMVIPENNTNIYRPDPARFRLRDTIEMRTCPWVTVLQHQAGAGFYTDVFGPLPFAFGPVPPERYYGWVLREGK